jgi:dihydrofolate reductase
MAPFPRTAGSRALTRRIIAYLATSADGYIARPDGDVAWLDRPRTAGDYGMAEFYRSIDTIVWGRKTYDFAVQVGQPFDAKKHNYVLSRRPPAEPAANVEFVTEAVDIFAKKLRQAEGSNVWLMGGAELFASFLDVGALDEFIIHVVPIFIGAGIPLLTPRHRATRLGLVTAQSFADGVVRLHYGVVPGKALGISSTTARVLQEYRRHQSLGRGTSNLSPGPPPGPAQFRFMADHNPPPTRPGAQ